MGVLITDGGRVRLGWRLSAFVAATLGVGLAVGALLPAGVVSASAGLLAGALVGGWWLLALDGRRPAALGFHVSAEAGRESGWGLVVGTVTGLGIVLLIAALGGVRWTAEGGTFPGWLGAGVAALLFFAVPAAAEEALLRGYPLQALGEAWGAGVAVVVTAVVFGLLHLGNPGAGVLETVNVAAAGLLLGAVYVRTLSLWWATGVHLGWNWAHGFLADVPVSGLEVTDAPLYEGVARGPAWLSGGDFGPEGSVVATVVVLAVAAAVWWGPWLTPGAAARAAEPLLGGGADEETIEG